MDTSTAEQVAQEFAPLGFALHEAMPTAISRATDMMMIGQMDPHRYATQYKHNIVGCTHSLLNVADLGLWRLDKRAHKKQLHLSKALWSVRLLASTYDDQIPNAGRNQARRAFYTNSQVTTQPLQQALLEEHGFLIRWAVNKKSSEVELELVHTLSPWKYGQRARVDLRMPLVADESDLANLTFTPADDDDLGDVIPGREIHQRGVIDGRGASS